MSMTDAEIREALARAERATPGPWHIGATYRCHVWGGGPIGHPKTRHVATVFEETNDSLFVCCARTDVPRLAADLLAARAERDEAQGASILNANAVRLQKARAAAAEARCAALEAERAIVADYLRDTDADFRARRPSERAVLDALLSPPPPHTCQIHRATSGASDCGLSPCEEAKVHRDRGASRPATVRRVRPAPSQEARCGSRTKLRGSDGRPLCERHGGVRADFQQNDEPCMRVKATPVEDMPRAQVQAELAARGIDVAPAVAKVMDALGRTRECACPDPRCAQHGSAPAPCSSCVGDTAPEEATTVICCHCGRELGDPKSSTDCRAECCYCATIRAPAKSTPAEAATPEAAKCATCGGSGTVRFTPGSTMHDAWPPEVAKPCPTCCAPHGPDCHGCGGGA